MVETRRGMVTEAERSFVSGGAPAHAEPGWLTELRDGAMATFEAEGLPDRKVEAFHYTDLKTLLREPYPPFVDERPARSSVARLKALAKRLSASVIPIVNGTVLVDGAVGRELPDCVEILPLGKAIGSSPETVRLAFDADVSGRAKTLRALNTGLARDGAVIRVRREEKSPLIVLHHSAELEERGSLHLRHSIVLEAGAHASIVEIFEDHGADHLTTTETLVHLGVSARLHHAKLVKETTNAVHLGRTDVRCAAGADYRLFVLGTGANLAREEVAANLEGAGAHIGIGGALVLSGAQHFDLTARVEHTAPHCTSEIEARAALGGHAKGVVQVSTRVAPDAQGTDARQLIRGLLLSPRAELDSKPELEILADDVKCSHGAASGDLDADAVFYLRTRGIPEAEARSLLIEAFLEESFTKIQHEALRELIREVAQAHLGNLSEAADG